jgi:hypothetical protein
MYATKRTICEFCSELTVMFFYFTVTDNKLGSYKFWVQSDLTALSYKSP